MASVHRALCALSLAVPATASLASLRGAVGSSSTAALNTSSLVDCITTALNTSSLACCKADPVACAQAEFNSRGLLVKNLGRGSQLNALMDQSGGALAWDAVIENAGVINDCNGHIQDCSAWAFLKQGLVPMVYNYPKLLPDAPRNHMVGLMAKLTPEIEAQLTRMHVVDGDTWQRLLGGLHPADVLATQLETYCPGWGGKDVNQVQYTCAKTDPYADLAAPWCDASTGRIEAPIGTDGRYWSDQFMYTDFPKFDAPELSKMATMVRQCVFWRDSLGKWDWDFFLGAMQSFYQKALYQQQNHQAGAALPDGMLYLENELNMEGLKPDAVMKIVQGGLLAVVVQTNSCEEQLASLGTAEAKQQCEAYFTQTVPPLPTSAAFPTPESFMIDESKRAACRLAKQLGIPAVEAKFTSNAVIDVENWEKYIGGKADAPDFLSRLDCCKEKYLAC